MSIGNIDNFDFDLNTEFIEVANQSSSVKDEEIEKNKVDYFDEQDIEISPTPIVEELVAADDLEDSVDIIGGPYVRETYDPRKIRKQPTEAIITYSTGDVAKMLNVTPETIRNYVERFNEWLKVKRSGSGRWIFEKPQVDLLRDLLKYKDENDLTMDQLLEYVSNPGAVSWVPDSQKMDYMAEFLSKRIDESIYKAVQEILLSERTLRIEQNNESNEVIKALSETVDKQKQNISELSELIRQQNKTFETKLEEIKADAKNLSDLQAQKDETENLLRKQISELEAEIKVKDTDNKILAAKFETIEKQSKEQVELIESLTKKRKKLFGIL